MHCIIVRYLSNVIPLGTIVVVLSLVCFELKNFCDFLIELNTRLVEKGGNLSFWLICVGFTAAARLDVKKLYWTAH